MKMHKMPIDFLESFYKLKVFNFYLFLFFDRDVFGERLTLKSIYEASARETLRLE